MPDEISSERRESHFSLGRVFELLIGRHHYGIWASEEDARKHAQENFPKSTPADQPPSSLRPVPDGQYFIQPREVHSYKPDAKISKPPVVIEGTTQAPQE